MNRFLSAAENIPLLKSLPGGEVARYMKTREFKVTNYKKNSVIHLEGQPCRSLEIILSGRVAVDRIDESGSLLTVSEFLAGGILGGNLLFSRNPFYPMTVTAALPSDILEIGKELLFELLCRNPEFLKLFLESVSGNASILGDKIKYYVRTTIRDSVLSWLELESRKQNSKTVRLTMTKKTLADKIGVCRTSLSRELAKMKKDGLILFDASSVELLR